MSTTTHKMTKKHLKTCWVCRLEKKVNERAHALAHGVIALGALALVVYVLVAVTFK